MVVDVADNDHQEAELEHDGGGVDDRVKQLHSGGGVLCATEVLQEKSQQVKTGRRSAVGRDVGRLMLTTSTA